MSPGRYDADALLVAQQVHRQAAPELTILFGSRARGDYRPDSDIDILVIAKNPPEPTTRAQAKAVAAQQIDALYHSPVPAQIVWKTLDEFSRMRRTVNHLIARAVDEGIIMPGNISESDARYAGGTNDHAYEWSVTDERIRHAEIHLQGFAAMDDAGMHDRLIGKNAQEAMEHALKAHISAAGVRYERPHNLNRLLQQVNAADPAFNFRPRSDYAVLNDYAGSSDYYEPGQLLTGQPAYRESVTSDIQTLLNRAAALRRQQIGNA